MARWRDIADKTVVGEKIDLTTLVPDEETLKEWAVSDRSWKTFWVRPRLYSIGGKDRVDAVLFKNSIQSHIPAELKLKMAEVFQENPDMKEEDLFKNLEASDKERILDAQMAAEVNNVDIVKIIIIEGLGENNIIGDGETIEDFAESVVKYPPLATEIVSVIRKHNLPLRQGTSEKSNTLSETFSEGTSTEKM